MVSTCGGYLHIVSMGYLNFVCSWKDLLPEVLNVLVEREVVENNGTEITGLEYKNQVIESLCLMEWSGNILILMVTMLM